MSDYDFRLRETLEKFKTPKLGLAKQRRNKTLLT